MPNVSILAKLQKLSPSSATPVTHTVSAKKNKDTASDPPRSETLSNVAVEKKVPMVAIMVPHAELEEFFSAVEKKTEEDFTAKYNFDFVNEVPMDGRYEWVKANKNKDTTPINYSTRSKKMEETEKVAAEKKDPEAVIKVPEAELKAFFSAAEKNIHKEFTDKYNFDFVNEDPFEGRYEWVKMTPSP